MRFLLLLICLCFSLAANAGGGGKSAPKPPPAPTPPPEPQAPKTPETAYNTAKHRVRRRAKNDTQITDGNTTLGATDIKTNTLGGNTTLGG